MIKSMYVHKDYRNQRIASRLMDILFEFTIKHKYRELVLETYDRLEKAIIFYQKRGFILEEKDNDRYVFKKSLN